MLCSKLSELQDFYAVVGVITNNHDQDLVVGDNTNNGKNSS